MYNTLIKYMSLSMLGFATLSAQAVSFSLLPANAVVQSGDQFSVAVVADFTGVSVLGGGFDVFFDGNLLEFAGFTFDSQLMDDPDFRRTPDVLENELNGIGFGNFLGMSGAFTIGELSFVAVSGGQATLGMALNEGGAGPLPGGLANPGPFYLTNGAPIPENDIQFNSATVQVVPLPAAVWFILGGLVSLLGLRRQK